VLAEVAAAGHCVHPIVLSGETVDTETGEIRRSTLRVACKDRRVAICPSCSYVYKTDTWILISAGLVGGKGLPSDVLSHPKVFVTLTAPGFGAVHRQTETGECHPWSQRATCVHGSSATCSRRHDDDEPMLGAPLCVDCFDYEGAVLWNASASALWHRTVVRLRQVVAATQGLSESGLRRVATIQYLKVAEFQRRGLVHLHAVIRADGADGPGSSPPAWLTTELLGEQLARLAGAVEVRSAEGVVTSWGRRFTITDLAAVDGEARRACAYLAKYATKSTVGAVSFARRFRDRTEIERAPVHDHVRQLALTAWDLGCDLDEGALKRHTHAFGFTGQLVTKSRAFSTTFGALRSTRAEHMARIGDPAVVALGAFGYAGRGYSDPRGETVARLLHSEAAELHQEARERRVEALRKDRIVPDRSRERSRDRSHDSRDGSRDRSRDDAESEADPQ
jgi:hypothetical protein